MEPAEPTTVTVDERDKVKPQKPMSREQRRFVERIETEARQMHSNLSEKFFNFFMEADEPEGKEVEEYFSTLDAKWKTYCSRRRLNESAFELFGKDCALLIDQFKQRKAEGMKKEPVTVETNSPEQGPR